MFYIDTMVRSVGYNNNLYMPNFKAYANRQAQPEQSAAESGMSLFALYLMTQGISWASEGVSKA